VTNVSRRGSAVKGLGAPAQPGGPRIAGREALEISKLLVEVLQLGHTGRRGGGDAAAAAEAAVAGTGGATGGLGDAGAAGGQAGAAGAPFQVAHGGAGAYTGTLPAPIASHVIRAAIHVYTHGPQTIGQLAAGLGVSQGWASRVVDEMEKAGYLARERDPQDRRIVRVSLVPAAIERVERAYTWRGDSVESALEGMTADERAAVRTFLARFIEAARAEG
jgi:DNA-binding MarR family transcriptional regulator